MPAPRPEARQPILTQAVTGQTVGQREKAKQAVARVAKKKATAQAKIAALTQSHPRMPLCDLPTDPAAPSERASSGPAHAAAQPSWLMQMCETAMRPAVEGAQAEVSLVYANGTDAGLAQII